MITTAILNNDSKREPWENVAMTSCVLFLPVLYPVSLVVLTKSMEEVFKSVNLFVFNSQIVF